MKTSRSLRKTWGLLTVFIYTVTSSVYAMPGIGIEVMPKSETPAFLSIDIPSDLAQVEEIYEAPPQVDPRLILHIQNAHGNYEAQVKIKKLLRHLYSTYGFRLFFVEGAVQKLNPDYLRIFPDNNHNVDVADYLAREGKLTGAEYYLVDAPEDVSAVGIEQAELYRANYEVFKEVYARQDESERFTDAVDQRLMSLASREFSQDLRRLVMEWKKFQTGHRAFMPFIGRLAQDAQKHLDLDLRNLVSQVEWPQITRLLILQSMERELDLSAGRRERDQVVAWLREHQVSEKVVAAIQGLEDRHIRMNRLEPSDERMENLPRYLLERLIEEAGPKGFDFTDFPAFSLYTGYFILKSEVDSKELFDEIDALFQKLLDKLAQTDHEKVLLSLLRDNLMIRKFLHLELTRDNWDLFISHQERLNPDAMIQRLSRLDPAGNELERTQALQEAFQLSLNFYTLARQRDSVFYYMIKQGMHTQVEAKSALLTGGFHTAGVFERFRKDLVNYGVLMPRLQDDISNENYVKSMLGETPGMFESATLELPASMESGDVLALKGVSESRVALDHLDAAVETDQRLVQKGVNPETDYYDADRFVRVVNESSFAKLRGIHITLDESGNFAYVFYRGEPIRQADGQFLTIPVVEIKNAEDRPVRVFATSTSATTAAPAVEAAANEDTRRAVVPPSAETITEANLRSIYDQLVQEAAAVPVEEQSRQDLLKQQILGAVRASLDQFPNSAKKLEATQLGLDFLSVLNQIDLADELANTEGKPQDRAVLLSLVSSLVAFGSVQEGIGERTGVVISRIAGLLEGRKTNLEKMIDGIREQSPEFVDSNAGEMVIVTDRLITDEKGIESLAAQLVVNPQLKIFFVFTPEEGGAADTAFDKAAKALVKNVEDVLAASGITIPNLTNRLAVQSAARNGKVIESRVNDYYYKKIQESARQRSAELPAEQQKTGVFVILTENGLASYFNQTSLPATIITSEPLSRPEYEVAQKFVAGKAAQHIDSVDNDQEITGTLLKDSNRQLRNVTYRINEKGLDFFRQFVNRLMNAFETTAATLRAA